MKHQGPQKMVFAAGGSGGHLFAAQSVATKLYKQTGVEVLFMSSGLNQGLNKGADTFSYHHVSSPPLSLKNPIKFGYHLAKGVFQVVRFFRKHKPIACVGFGSYHSVTTLIGALFTRTPIVLFESNTVPGKVIRLFSKSSLYTATALPTNHLKGVVKPVSFTCKHSTLSCTLDEAKTRLGLEARVFTYLVFGGSQGARFINELMLQVKGPSLPFQLIHLVGKQGDKEGVEAHYWSQGIKAHVAPFFEDMALAYKAAEACVSRCGALTLLEQIEYNKPSLLIPFAKASENHQLKNGVWMEGVLGGAHVMEEADLTGAKLKEAMCQMALDQKEFKAKKRALSQYKQSYTAPTLNETLIEQFNLKSYVLVGVGGIGMSALAHILLQQGQRVIGLDRVSSPVTDRLKAMGAEIYIGDEVPLVCGHIIVISSAIDKNHPLLAQAKKLALPIWHRSELFRQVMQGKKVIAVAGTHGKTSTSGLLAFLMTKLGFNPSFAVGGEFVAEDLPHGLWGSGKVFIAEADESDGSFLNYPVELAVLTNLEVDHLDYWQEEAALKQGFITFAQGVKRIFYCKEDPGLAELKLSGVSYGQSEGAAIQLNSHRVTREGQQFSFTYQGKAYKDFFLPLFGAFQVLNALPCLALCLELGGEVEPLRAALTQFSGMKKRLEYVGHRSGVSFYKDYAHHPTATKVTLKALRQKYPKRRLVCLYQPHRFSRMSLFLQRASSPFLEADRCVLFDVFSAGEMPTGEGSVQLLEKLGLWGHQECEHYADLASFTHQAPTFKQGDVVVMMGAGSIHNWVEGVVEKV